MVLHTFGRDLKWNPHIHCLISEGGLSDDGLWRNVHHFTYFLRSAFRTALLNEMHQRLGDPFQTDQIPLLFFSIRRDFTFMPSLPLVILRLPSNISDAIWGRPMIATSRIDKYDGSMVTFHYNRHEDDKYIQETHPVMDFIKRPIRHIPEKHFKMIRYGGLGHATAKQTSSSIKSFPNRNVPFYATLTIGGMLFFLLLVMILWNVPSAGIKWSFWNFIFNHQRLSLEELYGEIYVPSRGKRSLHNFLCFYGIIPHRRALQ